LKYKITEKTILKYLKEHKIPYNNRKIKYEMTRNCLDQYTFKYCQNQSSSKSDKTNFTKPANNQTEEIEKFNAYYKKYEKFLSPGVLNILKNNNEEKNI
jgi:hypothetical protein